MQTQQDLCLTKNTAQQPQISVIPLNECGLWKNGNAELLAVELFRQMPVYY